MASNLIVAEMRPDTCPTYPNEIIPVVVLSSHPRFRAGCRFDYGFLQVALREGYDVVIRAMDAAEGREP